MMRLKPLTAEEEHPCEICRRRAEYKIEDEHYLFLYLCEACRRNLRRALGETGR